MASITDLAAAITRFENVNPRYNNPGAIWDMSTNSIKQFPTYDAGYQALLNTINAKVGRGMSLDAFMAEYAPSMPGDPVHGTNDPAHYANVLAGWLGIDAGQPLNSVLNTPGGSSGGSIAPTFSTFTTTPTGDTTGVFDTPLFNFDVTTTLGSPDVPWWLYGIGAAALLYVATKRAR